MHRTTRCYLLIGLALVVWLADSLFFTLSTGLPASAALWAGVPALRLLFRLLVVLALLLIAAMGLIGQAVRVSELTRINKADDGIFFGAAESPVKSRRLLYHSLRLATVLRLRHKEKDRLRLLCYCYDIGMVGVPDYILEKEGALSREEQKIRDRHVVLGAEIARAIPELSRAAQLIACHEEYYNGGGPKSMYGRSIPLACRIFTTVLLYDFYTQPHAGGRALTTAEALDELDLVSGTVLDPDVAAAFRRLMEDRRLNRSVAEHVYAPQ